jgi:hypothetical protein
VVVKALPNSKVRNNKYVATEVLNHRKLKPSPNVIGFKGVYLYTSIFNIVMEYAGDSFEPLMTAVVRT